MATTIGNKVRHVRALSSVTVPVADGQVLLNTDTASVSVDVGDSRIRITDIVKVDSWPLAPIAGKLYVLSSGGARYYHSGGYVELTGGSVDSSITQNSTNPVQGGAIYDALADKLGDAPSDGKAYVRKDGQWVVAQAGGGSAPSATDWRTTTGATAQSAALGGGGQGQGIDSSFMPTAAFPATSAYSTQWTTGAPGTTANGTVAA